MWSNDLTPPTQTNVSKSNIDGDTGVYVSGSLSNNFLAFLIPPSKNYVRYGNDAAFDVTFPLLLFRTSSLSLTARLKQKAKREEFSYLRKSLFLVNQ